MNAALNKYNTNIPNNIEYIIVDIIIIFFDALNTVPKNPILNNAIKIKMIEFF